MNKRVAICARVSTGEQTPDNQLQELRAVADRMNWHVAAEYIDHGISGAKGREQRPGYDQLYDAIVRREIDLVMAWSVDRLGRSLQQLVALLSDLQAKNVDLYLHQQGIDTTTAAGKAMFQMCGVFAEFERAMIRERFAPAWSEHGHRVKRSDGRARPRSSRNGSERRVDRAKASRRSPPSLASASALCSASCMVRPRIPHLDSTV